MPSDRELVPAASGPAWHGRVTPPGKLDLSTDRGDAFRIWKERWEDYALLSGIESVEPRRQMAALRACLSDDTLRVVRNLQLSDEQRNDTTTIIKELETYAIGQVNEVVERKRFNSRVKADGESIDDFLTSLRDLSRSCNFCNSCSESLIRDRIVMGLRSTETVQKLCAEPKLSLAAALSICRAEEAACQDTAEIRGSGAASSSASSAYRFSAASFDDSPPSTSHCCTCRLRTGGGQPTEGAGARCRLRGNSPSPGHPAPAPRDRRCERCGRQRPHRGDGDCPALNLECYRCGRVGLFAVHFLRI